MVWDLDLNPLPISQALCDRAVKLNPLLRCHSVFQMLCDLGAG